MGLDSPAPQDDPVLGLDPADLANSHRGTLSPYQAHREPIGLRQLQVLAGADPLDGPAAGGFLALGHERAHVDDALALLARDLGPVVGVGGVGQVLVLLVLLLDRVEQVVGADAPVAAGDDGA